MKRLFILVLFASTVLAEKREPVFVAQSFGLRAHTFEAPAAAGITIEVPHELSSRNDDNLLRIGDVVEIPTISIASETVRAFRSPGAVRTRLRLEHVVFANDDVLRVVGEDGEAITFGRELLGPDGELWTPSVAGDTIEVRGNGDYEITALANIREVTPESDACFTDVSCHTFPDAAEYSKSIAALEFISGFSVYGCTGGLINGTDGDRQLLTANHCIKTASEAASLEATWDIRSVSCGGTAFSGASTNGATLLATSAATDVTLLRLSSLPAGRWLMGWSTATVPAGTSLYRISHPGVEAEPDRIYAQAYSRTSVNTTTSTCTGLSRPNYLYSTRVIGGIGHGSSGAPTIIEGGYIVGQLLGLCGPAPLDGCSYLSDVVDGSLRASYSALSAYLIPDTPSTTCTPNSTTACMLNNRFRVTVRYRNAFDNLAVNTIANLKPVQGFATPGSETAFFYFGNAANIEMMVKILDQGNTNSAGQATIAVLFGTATPLRIELSVQDLTRNVTRTYTSEFGQMRGVTDFTAFVK
ncbi:MAG: trypsin-like peptidase domain-containing protein [Thermoanaerobaculia bacterium]